MPLVIVDGADAGEQELSRWTDPAYSPLALAQSGTLFIDSAAALPDDTQQFLARALAERRSPGGGSVPLDLAIVVAVPATIDTLVANGRLSPSLADRFGDRAVPLPPLMARAEDLRTLVLDRLARLGLKLRGRPFGVDPSALARLIEHTWPGNDLELDDVMARATLATMATSGELVTGAELDRIGFVALPADATRRSSNRPSAPPGRRRIQGFRS
jgi:DNA-binding NtrC family response regulator